jgi:hypothetical protein
MKSIGLFVLFAMIAGCDAEHCPSGSLDDCKAQREVQRKLDKPIWAVRAEHDDLRSVTCWVTEDPRGGISCLPDWMLAKPEVKP